MSKDKKYERAEFKSMLGKTPLRSKTDFMKEFNLNEAE